MWNRNDLPSVLGTDFFFFFSLLRAEKLPSDNNIGFINAANIPRQMSVADTNENTP